jgi:hypothetical protein
MLMLTPKALKGTIGCQRDALFSHSRLVSLLDVLRFNAAFFVSTCSSLQSIRAEFQILQRSCDQSAIDRVLGWMEQLRVECQNHELQISEAYIGDVVMHLKSLHGRKQDFSINRFVHYVDGVEERICEELHSSWFFRIPKTKVGYYAGPRERLGQAVIDAFPSAIYDIEEAGKCYATERYTACVFHLMRVMEFGLHSLSLSLNDPNLNPKKNRSWDSMLKKCDGELRKNFNERCDEWRRDDQFFSNVTANLRAVKDAWRNPTMHVEKKYTGEEAFDIFNSVRAFMRHLAAKLKE